MTRPGRTTRGLRAAGIAAAASLVVHAMLTWALPARDVAGGADAEPVELELELGRAPVTPPDVVSGRAAAAASRTVPTVPAARAPGLRVRRSSSGVVLPPMPEPVATVDEVVPPAACDTTAPQPLHIDPRSAALAGLADESGVTTLDEAISHELGASLAATANARPWSSHREPPELRRTGDGGYEYRSDRFNAHIDPDGSVHFSDRDAVALEGPGNGTSTILGGHFDVTEALMRASGQDPLGPERAWFMRETEELRTRLDARARHADGERSLQLLAQRLAAIAADRSLTPARQRARVFETWDDCATDAIGDRARETIVAFAREHFPEGSELAYTRDELVALNARRVTHERFDPYRG